MFCFDLETYADKSCIEFLPEPYAPDNYKDPEKIARYKAWKREKDIAAMALDPATCRIVAIGCSVDGTVSVNCCPDEDVERAALIRFWNAWNNASGVPVGFNAVAYDAPVLVTRSRILGVPAPHIDLRKYGSPDVRDLMLELSFGGLVDYKSLQFWVKRLHLDVPKDDTSGKDVAAMVEAGDWHAIALHCTCDVIATERLGQYLDRL